MRVFRWFMVALFLVFLHFAGQVRSMTSQWNRFFFQWGRHNAVALAADMLLLAAAATAVAVGLEAVVRRLRRPAAGRVLGHVVVVAAVSGLLAAFPSFSRLNHPTLTRLLWLGTMLVVGISVTRPGSRLVRYTFNGCLLFSPAAVILGAQMFLWPTWYEPPRTGGRPRETRQDATPVFVFVFDQWSYARSVTDGEFRPFFRHVRRLARQAVVFRAARSPHPTTLLSVPRLIFQDDLELAPRRGQVVRTDLDATTLVSATPSLFALARRHGYRTCLVGWGLPYHRIVGDQVDVCHAHPSNVQSDRLLPEMGCALARNVEYWTDPVSRRLAPPLLTRLGSTYRYRMNAAMRDEVFALLGSLPRNAFGLFHLPVPHHPFIWTPDGHYRGPSRSLAPAGYLRNLRYLDHYVGQVVERLRAANRFDPALLVVTSDHVWKADPEPAVRELEDWATRVPLLIKLPHQTAGRAIDAPVRTNALRPFFEAVLAGERDPERLAQQLEALAEAPEPAGVAP